MLRVKEENVSERVKPLNMYRIDKESIRGLERE